MKIRGQQKRCKPDLSLLDKLVCWAMGRGFIKSGLISRRSRLELIAGVDRPDPPLPPVADQFYLRRRAMFVGAAGALGFLAAASPAQADQNFTSFAYPVTGGTVNRNTPDRFADIVNMKEYGAVGNGVTDDTTAIVAGFAAAFGSVASPHGQGNPFLNKPVYFPAGNYVTTTPVYLTNILGGKIFGAGNGSTQIQYQGTGAEGNTTFSDFPYFTPIFMLDGVAYTEFSDMSLVCNPNTAPARVELTTNATTAAGSAVLHFASVPASIHVGMAVFNKTTPESTSGNVISKTSTTVTVSANVASPGVGNGDEFYFVTSVMGVCLHQTGPNGASSEIIFSNMNFVSFGIGIFGGGVTTANCENCSLYDCNFQLCAYAGVRIVGFNTLNWEIYGGGSSECGTVTTFVSSTHACNGSASYSVTTGGITVLSNLSISGGTTGLDFYNAGTQAMNILGGRSESLTSIVVAGAQVNSIGTQWGFTTSTGCAIIDAIGGGTVVLSGCFISPSISGGTTLLAKLGNNGILKVIDPLFGSNADLLGITGASSAQFWLEGTVVPLSMVSFSTLFGSFTGIVKALSPLQGIAVSSLPTAAAKFAGLRGFVPDANATTFASTVATGGTNQVPIYCGSADGVTFNWKIG